MLFLCHPNEFRLSKRKKHKSRWKYYYWLMVLTIFVALIFMVRFVLNSSKVFVDKSTTIHPLHIEWGLERDGSLRINEPYFLKTDCTFIKENLDQPKTDSTSLVDDLNTLATLKEIKKPYLLWKNAESDTIHVLKNNVLLNFKLISD